MTAFYFTLSQDITRMLNFIKIYEIDGNVPYFITELCTDMEYEVKDSVWNYLEIAGYKDFAVKRL